MDLKKKITSSRYSMKDFSRHIAMLIGEEWSEAYYQRIRDLLNDERGSMTEQEWRAFQWWEYTFDNPFKASLSGFKLRSNGRILDQLWKYLRTGNFSTADAKRMMKKFKSFMPRYEFPSDS